jgi:hypothetical protein
MMVTLQHLPGMCCQAGGLNKLLLHQILTASPVGHRALADCGHLWGALGAVGGAQARVVSSRAEPALGAAWQKAIARDNVEVVGK